MSLQLNRRSHARHRIVILTALSFGIVTSSQAADLAEPITLASENGVLDILMVAKAAPVDSLSLSSSPRAAEPEGWVYEICKRPANGLNSCPKNGPAPNYYGGTLLQLQKGDLLKVHLVNHLPPAVDSKHATEPSEGFLALNPTNIHTHGLLVSPRSPSKNNPTYGDNVFVLTFNSDNGTPVTSPHMHADVRMGYTDYEIKIPQTHPSGLFWFHPHAHGLALNQVSAGLSGLITVGNIADYVCKTPACANALSDIGVRHIMLKDTQVLANSSVQDQEDPEFCTPGPAAGEPSRQGLCAGQNNLDEDGGNFAGGKWFFTLNGQPYPTVSVKTKNGEIWRITNSSGSVTYDLSLFNPSQNRNMIFQVLSIDGVSVNPTSGMSQQAKADIAGRKFVPESCPAAQDDQALCTRRLLMMPSSRVEVWVSYRNSNDALAAPHNSYAILRTNGYNSGPIGDSWPQIDLARVEFRGPASKDLPPTLSVSGEAQSLSDPTSLATDLSADNSSVGSDASCHALPPGHMRRIFYANPTNNPDAFGLGYEEIDEHGNVVGQPATDVTPFDPMHPTVCVPLGPGNSPATERWQLVNVAGEDHNFHVHQVKFRVLAKDEISGTAIAKGVMLDNVPLPHANGACGNNPPDDAGNPIEAWRAGRCNATPVMVEIPFAIAGDFVYHCHILEHEDGGMMARIRVRPNP